MKFKMKTQFFSIETKCIVFRRKFYIEEVIEVDEFDESNIICCSSKIRMS